MPGLPTHLVQELNVGTVLITMFCISSVWTSHTTGRSLDYICGIGEGVDMDMAEPERYIPG